MTDERHSKKNLYVSFELGKTQWKLSMGNGQQRRNVTVRAGDKEALTKAIARAKEKLGLPADCPVYACYEAGRDGFWVCRFLESLDIHCDVVDSASIEVDRRARRTKTDRLDAEKLLEMLQRVYEYGEKRVWKVVRVLSPEEEDARRLHREMGRLQKECTAHLARTRSLLALHGVKECRLTDKVDSYRDWEGKPLPTGVQAELSREYQRMEKVQEQMDQLEERILEGLKNPQSRSEIVASKLYKLKGIGVRGSWVMSHEFFGCRKFTNRRQVGGLAGLTGGRYDSGGSRRDLGITKAGNKRVRALAVELSWHWIRHQPRSALTVWFQKRFADGSKRMRRVGIVAVARKLLIMLWHFSEDGQVPEGAVLKAA
jgi:transposase